MRIKYIFSIALISCIFLSGCGNPKVGETYILKDSITGGVTPTGKEDAADEFVKALEVMNVDMRQATEEELHDAAEISGSNDMIETIISDSEIEIVKESEKYDSYLIRSTDYDEGEETEVWVKKDELRKIIK